MAAVGARAAEVSRISKTITIGIEFGHERIRREAITTGLERSGGGREVGRGCQTRQVSTPLTVHRNAVADIILVLGPAQIGRIEESRALGVEFGDEHLVGATAWQGRLERILGREIEGVGGTCYVSTTSIIYRDAVTEIVARATQEGGVITQDGVNDQRPGGIISADLETDLTARQQSETTRHGSAHAID